MTKHFKIMFHGHPYVVTAGTRSEAISKLWAKANPRPPARIQLTIVKDGQTKVLAVDGKDEKDAQRKLRKILGQPDASS